MDEHPTSGHNYYRLQQVDIDGKVNIQNKIVDLYRDANGNQVSIYPNPVSTILHCELFTSKADQITINIIDINGRIVKQLKKTTSTGYNTVDIDLSNVDNGIYEVQVIQNKQITSVQKLHKQD